MSKKNHDLFKTECNMAINLSDYVKRSLEYNWAKGKWLGLAPLGYLNAIDSKGNAHIIIDEERAPIIKRMFEEYATGLHSAQSLLTFATHLGLTARTFRNTNRRPYPLNDNTVYEILRNPFYYGVMKVKGKLIPHIYDKIIDKKLYDRVQLILEAKGNEAIIFARVSSEKQEKGASIDAQKECIYEYCKSKGLKIIKEYIITESTMRDDRKQYKEMIDFIKNRKQKTAIVINCVDRLKRSYGDTPILNDMLKKDKIEIHFMKEYLILSNHSTCMDIWFWNMCISMANSYV